MKVRIATRKSNLALVQTRWVAEQIRKHAPDVEIEEVGVTTKGDQVLDKPLATIGGKGLFVTEVEATLLDGRADIAVHSMKDVPHELARGLGIVCIPEREDPRDVLVTAEGLDIDSLEAGSRVGTSSLRRTSQLKARRPDCDFRTLRGNVETRLRKLDEGQYRAIVLALSGLKRLGYTAERRCWVVPTDVCIPAVGQGALGIEARLDDQALLDLLAPLEHEPSRVAVEAERAFLHTLEGSCKVPVAAYATLEDGGARLRVDGMVGSLDGSRILHGASDCYLRGERTRESRIGGARTLGIEVAEGLLDKGARALIRDAVAEAERALKQGNGGGGAYGKWS